MEKTRDCPCGIPYSDTNRFWKTTVSELPRNCIAACFAMTLSQQCVESVCLSLSLSLVLSLSLSPRTLLVPLNRGYGPWFKVYGRYMDGLVLSPWWGPQNKGRKKQALDPKPCTQGHDRVGVQYRSGQAKSFKSMVQTPPRKPYLNPKSMYDNGLLGCFCWGFCAISLPTSRVQVSLDPKSTKTLKPDPALCPKNEVSNQPLSHHR